MSVAPASASSSSSPASCPLCDLSLPGVRRLKTHLLLKHPEVNLCLFCVERKGWSDVFASQAQYNQHFQRWHEGSIREEVKGRGRARGGKEKAVVQKTSRRQICFKCDHKPEFPSGVELEQHLLTTHFFDYCKLCELIGPSATVRYHIGDLHKDALCHVCLGASPVFSTRESLLRHLSLAHGLSDQTDALRCLDCPPDAAERSVRRTRAELQSHLLERHLTRGDVMRPMRKRRSPLKRRLPDDRGKNSATEDEEEVTELEDGLSRKRRIKPLIFSWRPRLPVSPLANPGGQHCFAVAALHLLAQTDIKDFLKSRKCGCDVSPNCPHGIMLGFLDDYELGKADVRRISSKYSSFGVTSLPVDCASFVRGCLDSVISGGAGRDGDPFEVAIQWKFECDKCKRYTVTSLRDRVFRLDGRSQASLSNLLDDFLHRRKCGGCPNICEVSPRVLRAGKYFLLEIDRRAESDARSRGGMFGDEEEDGGETREILLYPLQLRKVYNLFGFGYRPLGSVHYHLEAEEGGGHYVTNLFCQDPKGNQALSPGGDFDELVSLRVHEDQVSRSAVVARRNKPDFDSDAFIVALERVEMIASDVGSIDVELSTLESPSGGTSSSSAQPSSSSTDYVSRPRQDQGRITASRPQEESENSIAATRESSAGANALLSSSPEMMGEELAARRDVPRKSYGRKKL